MHVKKHIAQLFSKIGIASLEFTVPKGTIIPSVTSKDNFQISQKETDQGIEIKIEPIESGGDVFESFPKTNDVNEMGIFKFIRNFSIPGHLQEEEALYSAIKNIHSVNEKIASELEPVIKEMDRLRQEVEITRRQATRFIKNSTHHWPDDAEKLLVRVSALLAEMEQRLEQYQANNQADYLVIAQNLYQSLSNMKQHCKDILKADYVATASTRNLKELSDPLKGVQDAGLLLKRLAPSENDRILIRHNTVMAVLAAVSVLANPVLKQQFISQLAKLPMMDYDTQVQRLCASILDLNQVHLLSDFSADLLINQKFIDKSCQSRLNNEDFNFFGLASRDEYENKIMWSYYTQSVENSIAQKIAAGDSLGSIFDFAAKTRKRLAKVRGEDYRFGEFRDNAMADLYSSQGKSVASKQIFPTLVSAIEKQQTSYDSHESPGVKLTDVKEGDVTPFVRTFQFSPTVIVGEHPIQCPSETVAVYYTKPDLNEIRSVAVVFKEGKKSQFTDALSTLDKHFLTRVRAFKFKSDDEFLTALGELTYALAKLYPLSRGSGAVNQWLVRGIVLYYTGGLISLNDLRLGDAAKEDERVPYDIYAQVIQDPKRYAEDFKARLMPYFSVLAKSKELLRLAGYQEKESRWVLNEEKQAKIAKTSNPQFLKKHHDLSRLAELFNSKEPLALNQLKNQLDELKKDSISYQKNKLSFFQSKVAKKSDEVIAETAKLLQSKK